MIVSDNEIKERINRMDQIVSWLENYNKMEKSKTLYNNDIIDSKKIINSNQDKHIYLSIGTILSLSLSCFVIFNYNQEFVRLPQWFYMIIGATIVAISYRTPIVVYGNNNKKNINHHNSMNNNNDLKSNKISETDSKMGKDEIIQLINDSINGFSASIEQKFKNLEKKLDHSNVTKNDIIGNTNNNCNDIDTSQNYIIDDKKHTYENEQKLELRIKELENIIFSNKALSDSMHTNKGQNINDISKDSDCLHEEGLHEKVIENVSKCLSHLKDDEDNAKRHMLMWRLARAHYYEAMETESLGPFSQHAKKSIFRGLDWAERALSLLQNNNSNPDLETIEIFNIHKWYAILLALSDRFVGDKERIRNSHLIRKHTLNALEIDNNDADLHHTLGRICFEIAKIPMMMKSMAKVAYGKMPEATYDEAKEHFQDAKKLRPNWKLNALYLAKVLIELKDKSQAKVILKEIIDEEQSVFTPSAHSAATSADDERALLDAKKVLKRLNESWW